MKAINIMENPVQIWLSTSVQNVILESNLESMWHDQRLEGRNVVCNCDVNLNCYNLKPFMVYFFQWTNILT